MGNAVSSDQQPVSAVESLGREKPTKLMAQLRAVWPQVEQALQAGHTLRLIHQRLNMAGIQISYGCLIVYRGRIKSGKKPPVASVAQSTVVSASPQDRTPQGFDPLANLHAQERKRRAAWQYPSGLPDINKLAK
jgi:hypothetical protein